MESGFLMEHPGCRTGAFHKRILKPTASGFLKGSFQKPCCNTPAHIFMKDAERSHMEVYTSPLPDELLHGAADLFQQPHYYRDLLSILAGENLRYLQFPCRNRIITADDANRVVLLAAIPGNPAETMGEEVILPP